MRTIEERRINLWIYNHSLRGISDQVDFFSAIFKQHGYAVSVSQSPSETALNVVIENFSAKTKDVLVDFCKKSRKRVAIIMTEHLDFIDNQIFIHGDPFGSLNDYMHPAVQLERIKCLFECRDYTECLFVLGDLPELKNIDAVLPGINVRTIPFPKLDFESEVLLDAENRQMSDFLFTGLVTEYRQNIIDRLRSDGYTIDCPQRFISRESRDEMNRSARIVLNIPQRIEWRWLSLMRIIAALRCGRATVSLGTQDKSEIAACCEQLDLAQPDWLLQLQAMRDDSKELYRKSHANYMEMAKKFEIAHPFPHDVFEFWAITDRLLRAAVG